MIPYGRHTLDSQDIDGVLEVLASDWLTQGQLVSQFEQKVAARFNVANAVAFNSATSALHAACTSLGVSQGDTVWTSPNSFVASANCARLCGAEVDFVDIDPLTYNICASALEKKLQATLPGRLPKVLIPVHFAGQPAAMREIYKLSREYQFKIVEDASHAIGATYEGSPVGNCLYSDISIFSFHPVKNITTAEGGVAVTNSVDLAESMSIFRTHGISRDPQQMTYTPDGPWYYEQISLGVNYRMNELEASLGITQLDKLDSFNRSRQEIAAFYDGALKELPINTPFVASGCLSSWHLYVVRIESRSETSRRNEVFEFMRSNGIGVQVHYIPIYRHPYYRQFGYSWEEYKQTEKYYSEALTLPIYPSLDFDQAKFVARTLSDALTQTRF